MLIAILIILFIYFIIVSILNSNYPEIRWDWKKIDMSTIKFPSSFIWGTATASHQVEGDCTNNNWYTWENSLDENGVPRIKDGQKAGLACDHWNRHKEDINLIKEIGVTHYRLSLEWSKIETSQGIYNEDAIHHYSEVIDGLIEKNITPVITLHHFTNPIWFDELGGFEKEGNVDYFLSFCEKVFSLYSDRVKDWCTINEPEVYAMQGYFVGVFPPGEKNPQLAIEVYKNLLVAHTRVYHTLKKMPNGEDSRIGLVKNIMQFDPYRRWHLLDWIVCRITNSIYNDMALGYLKDGRINVNYPFFAQLRFEYKEAAGATDFFGLNYYSHIHLKFRFNPVEFFENKYLETDTMTDMPYAMYPEGLYRAIQSIESLNTPIYITENGIADAADDRRGIFIDQYIYAVHKAIENGADVRGYFYWSLMDNFEWSEGYDMKFGLFEVNLKTQERTLREGSKHFMKIVNDSI